MGEGMGNQGTVSKGVRWDAVRGGFYSGLGKGWEGFIWLLKIVIPISFLTSLLSWSGLLNRVDYLMHPFMDLVGLPSIAALPILICLFTGIYGGIAAMSVLPLTKDEMTLMAIFMLMAHALIQEGIIQGRSGLHPLKATFFRLAAGLLTMIVAAQFLETGARSQGGVGVPTGAGEPFLAMLKAWSVGTLILSAKIFLIIMTVLLVLEILKAIGWIEAIVKGACPFLQVLGLSERVGTLWIIAAFFGVGFGAAAIFEEVKEGKIGREELERLHLSIGINHSLIDDPALFLALGLSPFWLWVPRLVMAILAVRLLMVYQKLSRKNLD